MTKGTQYPNIHSSSHTLTEFIVEGETFKEKLYIYNDIPLNKVNEVNK